MKLTASNLIGVILAAVVVSVLAALFIGVLVAFPVMLIAGALESRLGWDIAFGFIDYVLIIAFARLILPSSASTKD